MPELPLQGGREPPPVRSGEVELPGVGVEADGGGGGIVGRDSVLVLADAVEQLLSLVLKLNKRKRVGNSLKQIIFSFPPPPPPLSHQDDKFVHRPLIEYSLFCPALLVVQSSASASSSWSVKDGRLLHLDGEGGRAQAEQERGGVAVAAVVAVGGGLRRIALGV